MENAAITTNTPLIPDGFVYLSDVDPTIIQDVRYATNNNFIGRPVDGYYDETIILTEVAANKLKEMQAYLKPQGLGIKAFDGYRPQAACDNFWDWGQDPTDNDMMDEYYPGFPDKTILFGKYIARLSTHSRGSTIDLTLVNLETKQDLDMGSPFDFFGEISHTDYPGISEIAKHNRLLLKNTMEKFGFKGIPNEWWHFTLVNEPFTRTPEDHFNFPVAR